MKMVWFLIAMLLLAGCGVGPSSTNVFNGTGSSTGSGGTEVTPGTPTGNVIVNITSSDEQKDVERTVKAQPAPTKLRLVITNPSLQVNGSAYTVIVDGAMVSSITLAFPVANGYTFQVVTYTPQGVQPGGSPTVNRMLKYAIATPVNITPSGATVNLSTTPIVANFTLPNPTYSNQSLVITANIPAPTPLQTTWNLFISTSPIIYALHTTTLPIHNGIRAPIVSSAGTLYAQGEFFIKNSMLDTAGTLTILDSTNTSNTVAHTAEDYHNWTFNYPNPEFGDPDLSVPLDLVPVTIPIS